MTSRYKSDWEISSQGYLYLWVESLSRFFFFPKVEPVAEGKK
jgi:hypothetical protein